MRPRRSGTAPSGTGGARSPMRSRSSSRGSSAYSSFGAYTTEPTVAAGRAPGGARADRRRGRLLRLGRIGRASTRRPSSPGATGTSWAGPRSAIIVSREHGYHGMHAWGTALAGIPGNKAGYGGEIIEEVVNVGRRRHREPRRAVRVARRRDRRVHRRAGHRGRRGLPARAVVLGRGPAAVPRARRPAHRRRGHHRVRADRRAVGLAALRRSSRT